MKGPRSGVLCYTSEIPHTPWCMRINPDTPWCHSISTCNKDLSDIFDAVQQYAEILKLHYKYQPIVATDWPPRVGEGFFGRLVLVEKQDFSEQKKTAWYQLRGQVDKIVRTSRKKLITVNNILQPTKSPPLSLRVVIDGPPGIGKTTLCRKLLSMWSNGTLHQEYELVLYCPFRKSKIKTATTLADLFVTKTSKISEVVKQMSDKEGKGLLLIFDGWDELSEQLRESSLAASIIRREELVHCSTCSGYWVTEEEISTVIIQTLQRKPRLAQKLISYVGMSNTVAEMDEDSDDNCSNSNSDTDCDLDDNSSRDSDSSSSINIDSSDSNDEFELEFLVNEDSQLALTLINDLNIRIYCKEGHLPTTLTELYENFILQTIKRHATARCDIDPHTLGSLSSLPALFAKPLQGMCQIAYTNLASRKMTFTSHQLLKSSLSSEAMNENYLGLITKFPEYDEENCHFLHLSIQEFLAAWWIAKHEKKTEEVFMDHFNDDHFRMCLRFVAGLTHLEHESYQQYFNKRLELHCKDILFGCQIYRLYGFCQNLDIYLNSPHDTAYNFDNVSIFLFQLLYESQNTKLCQSIHNESLSVFTAGLTTNSPETQCKRFEAWFKKPTDTSICKLLQPLLINNIQECYCFLNLPQLKTLHLEMHRYTIPADDFTDKCNCTELEKCIEMNLTLLELKTEFDTKMHLTSTIISVIRGVTKNSTITSFSLQCAFGFNLYQGHVPTFRLPNGVLEQLLKDNNKLQALSLEIPDALIPSSLNIVEVNTPLTALEIGWTSNILMTSLLPQTKGLHYLILYEPYSPHLLFLSHPSLHTLILPLDTAENATELFTSLQTNTMLKALGIFLRSPFDEDEWKMNEEQNDKSSVGASLKKMLTQNQNLEYFETFHASGAISSSFAFLSSLRAGIQHNFSLQQLKISLELPNHEQIRHLLN
uniref:NACHT domain-containing protein n=1 Tax=Amphimedon queenslandica TaxID=400682 RepID=A0A1X7T1U7_AMPQE